MTLVEFLNLTLGEDATGHDPAHALRVLDNARLIMEKEGGDASYIEGCCLLHDCLDSKLGLNTAAQEEKLMHVLHENGYSQEKAEAMLSSMKRMSFHLHDEEGLTLEDKIIRDADRLDAIGQIGIKRALAYGKAKGRPLFSLQDREDILLGKQPHSESTVSHFFEKLLLLDKRMYTEEGRRLAKGKREEMVLFLKGEYAKEGLPFDEKALP